ncbi:L,D-transpeptidase family protein [Prosthecochloris sp. SCSIO W1101]|uniref:L,D-transpeptidase n=1 Tax=Prosthecochloris sp. SCSIO W1101 TaxID=2992242 RepID=UPI00223D1C7D|nr:L,D-transpeptidase family protein [Prosthecochloris sp. SCSIO W1101]UZJ42697.1 L,D-transpeptidase family protein [Prosthecochloris sp. SCSIO W1101]
MLIIRTFFILFLVMGLSTMTYETLAMASSAVSSGSEKTAVVPEGFGQVKLDKAESLDKLCNRNLTCETIFMKVNKVDRRHISAGKTVLLPVDIEKASQYTPVPQQLNDSRGEREVRVFLNTQYFGAYENGNLLFWGPISSGRKSNPTWPGEFFVNYKQRHKRSIKYNNAPMPYSINYDGPYFIHQQSLPGHPASRGCVRLLEADAKRLFSWMKVGDSVTVL